MFCTQNPGKQGISESSFIASQGEEDSRKPGISCIVQVQED